MKLAELAYTSFAGALGHIRNFDDLPADQKAAWEVVVSSVGVTILAQAYDNPTVLFQQIKDHLDSRRV